MSHDEKNQNSNNNNSLLLRRLSASTTPSTTNSSRSSLKRRSWWKVTSRGLHPELLIYTIPLKTNIGTYLPPPFTSTLSLLLQCIPVRCCGTSCCRGDSTSPGTGCVSTPTCSAKTSKWVDQLTDCHSLHLRFPPRSPTLPLFYVLFCFSQFPTEPITWSWITGTSSPNSLSSNLIQPISILGGWSYI